MVDSVTVVAPARLHLGFLDLNGGLGRRFGSLGLAIDAPATRVSLHRAATAGVEGAEGERAARHLDLLARRFGLTSTYKLTIGETIPAHAGLGSGTQLALAVAAALRRLEGMTLDPAGDAAFLQRGERSGIGLGLFERGGLIVDGGRGERTAAPPVIARMEFPPEWRVIIVLDRRVQGAHGAQERAAFAQLAPLESAAVGEICRLVLVKALPALAERDFDSFGDAIARLQDIVGHYFAPAQGGGPYASPRVAEVMRELRRHGAKGTGQSSWGPTGFAFAPNANEARHLCDLMREKVVNLGLDIAICKGLNHGALVKEDSFAAVK